MDLQALQEKAKTLNMIIIYYKTDHVGKLPRELDKRLSEAMRSNITLINLLAAPAAARLGALCAASACPVLGCASLAPPAAARLAAHSAASACQASLGPLAPPAAARPRIRRKRMLSGGDETTIDYKTVRFTEAAPLAANQDIII